MNTRHAYIRDGAAIYERSFAIIRAESDLSRFSGTAERVVVRMIHACGMTDLPADVEMSPDFAGAAEAALKAAREKGAWPEGVATRESDYLQRSGPSGAVPAPVRDDAFARLGQDALPEQVLTVGTDFYVYQILDTRPGKNPAAEAQRANLEKQLLAARENKLVADWLSQLRSGAKIWTNNEMLK